MAATENVRALPLSYVEVDKLTLIRLAMCAIAVPEALQMAAQIARR